MRQLLPVLALTAVGLIAQNPAPTDPAPASPAPVIVNQAPVDPAPQMETLSAKTAKPGDVLEISGIGLSDRKIDEIYLTDHKFDMRVKVRLSRTTRLSSSASPPFAKPGRMQIPGADQGPGSQAPRTALVHPDRRPGHPGHAGERSGNRTQGRCARYQRSGQARQESVAALKSSRPACAGQASLDRLPGTAQTGARPCPA